MFVLAKKKRRIFLVDYENTRAAGFAGVDALGKNDEVYIFFSEHVAVLPFAVLPDLLASKAKIDIRKVFVGTRNALDFQLSSFLGFRACSMNEKEKANTVFVIVSHDNGYDVLIPFWQETAGVSISRNGSIAAFDVDDPFVPFIESLPAMAKNVANSLLARGLGPKKVISFFSLFVSAHENDERSASLLHSFIMKKSHGDMSFAGETYRLFKPLFLAKDIPDKVAEVYKKFF